MTPRRPRAPTKRQLDVVTVAAAHREPTRRQLAALKAYHEHIEAAGAPPTASQLARRLGICRSGAYQHIRSLARKGYLVKALDPRGLYSPSATARARLGQVRITRTPEDSGHRITAQLGEHRVDAHVHADPERGGIYQRRAAARLAAAVIERALLAEALDLALDQREHTTALAIEFVIGPAEG